MIDVKTIDAADGLRAAHSLFRAALHQAPADDAGWEFAQQSYPPGRTFGGYAGGQLVGTTMSFPLPMTVPGGAVLPAAGVTRVGVRVDHTRRGVLTALMREQLAAIAAAGEPLASLRASEYPIYGRFGYGVATRGMDLRVDPRRGDFHPAAPVTGDVRLVPRAELTTVLPEVYALIGARRPGMLHRSDLWWRLNLDRPGDDRVMVAAVHSGPDGDDGYVLYHSEKNPTPDDPWGTGLRIVDLHSATVTATAALWRFVLRVDLVNQVSAWLRPLDEPLHLLLADQREVRPVSLKDEAWLRLVDVPAALAGRTWTAGGATDPVVLAVRDPLLPANTGSYRITPDGVSRVDDEPQLECDIAVLCRLYLGDAAPSVLAATGWLTANDPAALPVADALFATGVVPWSGTFF